MIGESTAHLSVFWSSTEMQDSMRGRYESIDRCRSQGIVGRVLVERKLRGIFVGRDNDLDWPLLGRDPVRCASCAWVSNSQPSLLFEQWTSLDSGLRMPAVLEAAACKCPERPVF